jgi:hypothetical protein
VSMPQLLRAAPTSFAGEAGFGRAKPNPRLPLGPRLLAVGLSPSGCERIPPRSEDR